MGQRNEQQARAHAQGGRHLLAQRVDVTAKEQNVDDEKLVADGSTDQHTHGLPPPREAKVRIQACYLLIGGCVDRGRKRHRRILLKVELCPCPIFPAHSYDSFPLFDRHVRTDSES